MARRSSRSRARAPPTPSSSTSRPASGAISIRSWILTVSTSPGSAWRPDRRHRTANARAARTGRPADPSPAAIENRSRDIDAIPCDARPPGSRPSGR
jgi:hypothetical protein